MGIETLAALSLATTVVGGVTSAIGQQQQGAAAQQAANYQAQVAANNAELARRQAQEIRSQGQENLIEQGRKVAARMGSQRAALAAAGVDLNSGTAQDDAESVATVGRLDELRILGQATQKAFEADTQAVNYLNESNLTRMKGKSAAQAGNIAAFGSLVSAAGSFSSKWSGMSRTGAIPSWGE